MELGPKYFSINYHFWRIAMEADIQELKQIDHNVRRISEHGDPSVYLLQQILRRR